MPSIHKNTSVYGYDNVDGEMVIVSEQAEIVKQIFADTLAGKSTHEIAEELNERGVATKKGGHWTPGTVNAIIGNEKYTGDVLFQKTYTDSSFNRHQNQGYYHGIVNCIRSCISAVTGAVADVANKIRSLQETAVLNWLVYIRKSDFSFSHLRCCHPE